MFDWIPWSLYSPIYFYILSVIVFVVVIDSHAKIAPKGNKFQTLGVVLLIFSILYIGFRPLSGHYFGDTSTYANKYKYYGSGGGLFSAKDLLFNLFMKGCSYIMNVHMFFTLCAILYVVPLYKICKKWFKELWFFGFIFFIVSFSFWSYGTNGIRNGIAGSIFLLGVSKDKRTIQVALIFLSILIHKSMLLPAFGFISAIIYNKPKIFIAFWLLSIPLSLIAGGAFETFFGKLGFDERLSYLTEGNVNNDNFSSTGFRWDFLIYSATAIFAGWYYIVKKNYNDKIYFWIFNTYVFANAFWILVIRANFSNRFAYLSWFMIGLVIVYPLLRKTMLRKQYKTLGIILTIKFAFTFLMNIILG
ncbi:hypothetical protein SCB49_12249 [unidentified eubacterium SCB49]|nr:hypothetical protein SCB49_12249 [unidentified eubacterium SCB49]